MHSGDEIGLNELQLQKDKKAERLETAQYKGESEEDSSCSVQMPHHPCDIPCPASLG